MLKQRVITALLLLPLVMAVIFALPPLGLMLLAALALVRGSWEYALLAGLESKKGAWAAVGLQAVVFVVMFLTMDSWKDAGTTSLMLCSLFWLLALSRLFFFRPGQAPDATYRILSAITALLSVTTGWFAISWVRMQDSGSWMILLLLLIVWAADTGAYFAGKSFGKRKLAPAISPGKTLAGLVGGLVLAPLVALAAMHLMPVEPLGLPFIVLLSLATALVSVGGDLLVSLHKRISGLKDSGDWLPGHGGILDRLDSLIAAAPFFALGLLLAGY
jgi:phosphatidate cytidylyltransferase